jgi:DNA repair protein RadA/Sms
LESPAYYGRCPDCGGWNTLVETVDPKAAARERRPTPPVAGTPARLVDVASAEGRRYVVPMDEFNRVLGGGIVPGSLVLVGGDPGIGKSTLLLQVAAMLAQTTGSVLYVSAEESAQQVRLRADRLGVKSDGLYVLPETNLESVLLAAEQMNPGLLIVDSIQTVYLDDITSAAGSVSQVRECTARLMHFAKPRGIPVLIVGHVTKEGAIAGPRVLEHMVDAVLYLEGDRYHQYRVLRGVKNRFGSTDEVGVFEMADSGMREVRNPSEAFLQERGLNAAGSAVAVTLEGTRPILLEVQALSTSSSYGLPRRTANGFDSNRLQMLVAVLTKRVGLGLGGHDVYVNVVGGLRVVEPAVDLGVAVALASSFRETRVDPGSVLIGEVGLSGELRSVNQLDRRLNEAAKLGFKRAIVPAGTTRCGGQRSSAIEIARAATVAEAIEIALADR